MRILLSLSMAFLWMCGSDEPVMPPAAHGGVVMAFGAQPLELVTHSDGQITAYPVGGSTLSGPTATVIVHMPGSDGVVHPTPLVWDAPTATFVGTMPVPPRVGPIEADAIVAGAPVHATAPVFVVLAPAAPVVVGAAPATIDVRAHGRGHPVVVEAPRPGVVVEAPRPGVIVEAPRPVYVEPPRPMVVVEPPRPPGVVLVEPPRPGIVVERRRDEDGDFDEGRGHWDHGRHGGEGPEWHGGGGGEGHGHGHGR
jgi:hypothetical protein